MAELGLLHAYGLVTYLLYRALGSLRLDHGKRTASLIRIHDPIQCKTESLMEEQADHLVIPKILLSSNCSIVQ